MKNEKLKNAIVKATDEIMGAVNEAKSHLNQANNIAISEVKDIQFEVKFNETGVYEDGTVRFTITASKIPTNNLQSIASVI